MKYRDLVFVLALVSVVVVWFSRPDAGSSETPNAKKNAAPLVVKNEPSPAATPARKSPRAFPKLQASSLSLKVVTRGDTLSDLVLDATLNATSETTIMVDKSGIPQATIAVSDGSRTWNFDPTRPFPEDAKVLKKGEEYNWQISLKDHRQPPEFDSLMKSAEERELKIIAFLSEGSGDSNPMSRRIQVLITGETTLAHY